MALFLGPEPRLAGAGTSTSRPGFWAQSRVPLTTKLLTARVQLWSGLLLGHPGAASWGGRRHGGTASQAGGWASAACSESLGLPKGLVDTAFGTLRRSLGEPAGPPFSGCRLGQPLGAVCWGLSALLLGLLKWTCLPFPRSPGTQ